MSKEIKETKTVYGVADGAVGFAFALIFSIIAIAVGVLLLVDGVAA